MLFSLVLLFGLFVLLGCMGPSADETSLLENLSQHISSNGSAISVDVLNVRYLHANELKLDLDPYIHKNATFGGDVKGTYKHLRVAERAISGDQIKNYTIGAINVDRSEIQLRIKGSCDEGEAIRAVYSNGSVLCERILAKAAVPSLADILTNGSDTEGKSISGLSSLSTNKLCLNGYCIYSWNDLIPDLASVLHKDNDAGEQSIYNVKRLDVKEICLNGVCKDSWGNGTVSNETSNATNSTNTTNSTSSPTFYSYSCQSTQTSAKTCIIAQNGETLCYLEGVHALASNPHCVVTCRNNQWQLEADNAVCYAMCTK